MKRVLSILIVVFALVILGCSKSALEAPLYDIDQKSLSTTDEKPIDIGLAGERMSEEDGGGISDDEDEDDDEGKNKTKNRGDLN